MCSKSRHLYIIYSKCMSPARTQARRCWRHDAKCIFNERVIQTVLSFLMRLHNFSTSEADIASIFKDNDCHSCLWLFDYWLKYTYKYCVDGYICHLKFPTVVLVHILREVGTFYYLLQNLYSAQIQANSSQRRWRIARWGTWLAMFRCAFIPVHVVFFIGIVLYRTDTEHKTGWCSFFEARCRHTIIHCNVITIA